MDKHIIRINRLVDSPLEDYEARNKSHDKDLEILNSFVELSQRSNNTNYYKDTKKKEKKKKKKKDKKKDKKKKKDKNNLDLSGLNIFGEDEKNPEEKKKMKESDDFYEYRFQGSLLLLANLMKEINMTTNEAKEFLDKMKKGRIKASPASIANQTSNITALLGTKLSTIKEITMTNSKISELELKRESAEAKSAKGKEDAENNTKLIIDKMFDRLMDTDIPTGPEYDKDDLDMEGLVSGPDTKKDKKKISKSIDDRIKELENSGDIAFTDSELAFKYENDNVRIVIKKDVNNNRWKFEAINEDGDELYDYPLPNKKTIGRVKFDMESLTAKDGLNRVYDIIPVQSLNEDEDDIAGVRKYTGAEVDDDDDDIDFDDDF